MTEYTSWDNYVKEQEQKKAISKQWRNEYTFMADLNPNTASNFRLHERIKKSEDEIATLDNVLLEIKHKVKDLDTKIDYDRIILDNFANSIDELRKKIKDLEERHRVGNYEYRISYAHQRIDKLESKKDVVDSLFNKVIALEERMKAANWGYLEDSLRRIDKLEEWHKFHDQMDSDESAMKGMYIQDVQRRVKDLEEWKRQHHSDCKPWYGKFPSDSKKIEIDKKVWEDIRYTSWAMFTDINIPSSFGFNKEEHTKWNIKHLYEAIKKADPTFCDND